MIAEVLTAGRSEQIRVPRRGVRTPNREAVASRLLFDSPVAQLVERAAVNRVVVRSIRTWGAKLLRRWCNGSTPAS